MKRKKVGVARMSTTYFQKPENALKRSEELISVGQKSSALDVLETVIKSKRHRQWSPILEDIVKKFLSLCTEARQPRRAREGLVQYRQITQSATQGPDSIRKVVANFVAEGESMVREAERQAGLGADAVANLQDLEAEETPETMMISVLTGDLSDTGRADRDNYVQWLRFLWESYRTCLEVLKNNAKLEELYADTAKKTFAFCVRYKRKVEFRRLKDLLKAHLSNSQLNTSYGAPTQEASLRLRLEIRAEQLNAACTLELWQLAFESAEELHPVLTHAANRKAQKGSAMLNYYDKVSQVFWVSDNYLFHACAMQRIYQLTEKQLNRQVNKNEMTREEANKSLETLASKVLLGALSVPPPPVMHLVDADIDPDKAKHERMAALVGYSSVPQRKAIIHDLVAKNIMSNVPPELAEMYNFVETEFDPLNLSKRIKPLFAAIEKNAELVRYLMALKQVVLLKLVQQLSQVYQTMRISDFAKLADFLSLHDCEKLIVQAVSNNQAAARLDHKNGTLNLGDKGFERDTRRWQLTNLAKGLQVSLDLMSRDNEQLRAMKLQAFRELAEKLEDERKMMDYRRQQIEERKETQEKEAAEKAVEEQARKKREEEERQSAEAIRKELDKKKREEDKKRQEQEANELAEKKRIKEQMDALKKQEKKKKGGEQSNDPVAAAVEVDDDDELKNIDKTELIKAKKAQEEKLKREAEERMKQAVLKLDHLERARRENERDLLEKVYEQQKEQDKQRWEVESKQFMENHKKKHEEDVEAKKRMLRMVPDKDAFETMLLARRKEEYEREKAQFAQQAKADLERRRRENEERARMRREDQERQDREDEEKRKRQEEERKRREEEKAKLDEIAERQREREKEIEAKRLADRGPSDDRGPPRAGDRWGGGGGGGDRDAPRAPMGDRWAGGGGDRDGPRGDRPGGGGGGDRWGGGGDRGDRPPMDRGNDRWGGSGGGGGDRGDRPPMDRGGDRWGGGGGDRGGGGRYGGAGDRPPMDRGGGGSDRWGGGGGDRGPDRGGDRDRGGGGGGDRWGGGGGGGNRDAPPRDGPRSDRPGGGGDSGGWRSERAEPAGERRGGGGGDRWGGGGGGDRDAPPRGFGDRDGPRSGAPPSERPRLNLAPRSTAREDAPAAAKVDDDGFATVTKKR